MGSWESVSSDGIPWGTLVPGVPTDVLSLLSAEGVLLSLLEEGVVSAKESWPRGSSSILEAK